jgi:hypothetical protein
MPDTIEQSHSRSLSLTTKAFVFFVLLFCRSIQSRTQTVCSARSRIELFSVLTASWTDRSSSTTRFLSYSRQNATRRPSAQTPQRRRRRPPIQILPTTIHRTIELQNLPQSRPHSSSNTPTTLLQRLRHLLRPRLTPAQALKYGILAIIVGAWLGTVVAGGLFVKWAGSPMPGEATLWMAVILGIKLWVAVWALSTGAGGEVQEVSVEEAVGIGRGNSDRGRGKRKRSWRRGREGKGLEGKRRIYDSDSNSDLDSKRGGSSKAWERDQYLEANWRQGSHV